MVNGCKKGIFTAPYDLLNVAVSRDKAELFRLESKKAFTVISY